MPGVARWQSSEDGRPGGQEGPDIVGHLCGTPWTGSVLTEVWSGRSTSNCQPLVTLSMGKCVCCACACICVMCVCINSHDMTYTIHRAHAVSSPFGNRQCLWLHRAPQGTAWRGARHLDRTEARGGSKDSNKDTPQVWHVNTRSVSCPVFMLFDACFSWCRDKLNNLQK